MQYNALTCSRYACVTHKGPLYPPRLVLSPPANDLLQMVDVGCGIGGSSRHIAKKFGCKAEGITLSPVQVSVILHVLPDVAQ